MHILLDVCEIERFDYCFPYYQDLGEEFIKWKITHSNSLNLDNLDLYYHTSQ